MKTQYTKLYSVKTHALIFVNLKALVGDAVTSLVWRDLSNYKVTLVSPKKSGAYILDNDKRKDAYYSVTGNTLAVSLEGLRFGSYRLTILAVYGTNTRSQHIIDIECSGDDGMTETDINHIAIETIGDGTGDSFDPSEIEQELAGKADGSVYKTEDKDTAVVAANKFEVRAGMTTQFAISSKGEIILFDSQGEPVLLSGDALKQLLAK